MSIDLSSLIDYAWSDIAKAAKLAMVQNALGGNTLRAPDGREIGRISMKEAQELYNFALAQANAEASGSTGNSVLVQFGDATDSSPRRRQ